MTFVDLAVRTVSCHQRFRKPNNYSLNNTIKNVATEATTKRNSSFISSGNARVRYPYTYNVLARYVLDEIKTRESRNPAATTPFRQTFHTAAATEDLIG